MKPNERKQSGNGPRLSVPPAQNSKPDKEALKGQDSNGRESGKISLGQTIKSLRKEKGLSQEDLARKAELDQGTISRVERGIIQSLSLDRLENIAHALGLGLETLVLKAKSEEIQTLRGQTDHIEFTLDYPEEGFRIASFLPATPEVFFGKIEIAAKKTAPPGQLPHKERIYLYVLEGTLVLTRLGSPSVLKAGDWMLFSGLHGYELYNSDLLCATRKGRFRSAKSLSSSSYRIKRRVDFASQFSSARAEVSVTPHKGRRIRSM